MLSRATLLGRLVRAEWYDEEQGEREDTCVIIRDEPAGLMLFPLGTPARRRRPGQPVMTVLPLAVLPNLCTHPWAFGASSITRRGTLVLFARGRQYYCVEEVAAPHQRAEPMRSVGRQRRARPRRKK
jgi:hypothetical protein